MCRNKWGNSRGVYLFDKDGTRFTYPFTSAVTNTPCRFERNGFSRHRFEAYYIDQYLVIRTLPTVLHMRCDLRPGQALSDRFCDDTWNFTFQGFGPTFVVGNYVRIRRNTEHDLLPVQRLRYGRRADGNAIFRSFTYGFCSVPAIPRKACDSASSQGMHRLQALPAR